MIEQRLKGIPVVYELAKFAREVIRCTVGTFRLKRALAKHRSRRIVVGASHRFDEGWIPTEVEFLNLLRPGDWERFFRPGAIDVVLAEHVWEHLTEEEGVAAAGICLKYLRSGGYVRAAVPDGFHPDPAYIEWVKVEGTGPDADSHKVLYNYRTFGDVFRRAGFRVELYEYYDEEGRFHVVEWRPEDGRIRRSRIGARTADQKERYYNSIVLDAVKP